MTLSTRYDAGTGSAWSNVGKVAVATRLQDADERRRAKIGNKIRHKPEYNPEPRGRQSVPRAHYTARRLSTNFRTVKSHC